MHVVDEQLAINIPAAKVWQVISDYGNIADFHPMVKNSPILSENVRGTGAVRRCEFYDNSSIIEKVISWNEGKDFEVVLSEMSMPLKSARAKFFIEPMNDVITTVGLRMEFELKFGPLGWLMAKVMMKPMLSKMFGKVLKSLEVHIRSGQKIGENGCLVA